MRSAACTSRPAARAPRAAPPTPPDPLTSAAGKTVTFRVAVLAPGEAGSRIDPELAQHVTQVARDEAAEIIARHGGTSQSALGGEIVGLFGSMGRSVARR